MALVITLAAIAFSFGGPMAMTNADGPYTVNSGIPKPADMAYTAYNGTVQLSWGIPGGQLDGYQVQRRLIQPGVKKMIIAENTGTVST